MQLSVSSFRPGDTVLHTAHGRCRVEELMGKRVTLSRLVATKTGEPEVVNGVPVHELKPYSAEQEWELLTDADAARAWALTEEVVEFHFWKVLHPLVPVFARQDLGGANLMELLVFVSYLLDRSRFMFKAGRCDGGWFPCPTAVTQQYTTFPRIKQYRFLKTLGRLGYAQTKRDPRTTQRLVLMNTLKLGAEVFMEMTANKARCRTAQVPAEEGVGT